MAAPKIAIVFYSTYGSNKEVAELAAEASRAADAEVRLRRIPETAPAEVVAGQPAWQANMETMKDIPEVTHDDMDWADGYFYAVPTRFGNVASQVQAFIDTLGPLWQRGALAGKTFTATASAQNAEGGQTQTILSLYTSAMHWGAILVAPGYADVVKAKDGGTAYGYTLQAGKLDDTGRRSIAYQAERLASVTARLTAAGEMTAAA